MISATMIKFVGCPPFLLETVEIHPAPTGLNEAADGSAPTIRLGTCRHPASSALVAGWIQAARALPRPRLLAGSRESSPPRAYHGHQLHRLGIGARQEFREALQGWIRSQIPGQAEGLEQLVCITLRLLRRVGNTLSGSAVETDGGNHRVVARVIVMPGRLVLPWPRRSTTHTNPASAHH